MNRQAIGAWLDRQANPLSGTDLALPLDDLRALRVGAAEIVGLGESAHGAHDQFWVKARVVRFLVEEAGFRTVALEEDFAHGIELDRYVTTGDGDPTELALAGTDMWRTAEMVGLLGWLREHNRASADPVRVLGTDITRLRTSSIDAVVRYVGDVAPDRLAELERVLEPIRPRGDPREHIVWYFGQTDKQSLIDAATRCAELVTGLRGGPEQARAYAHRHAEAILGWYTFYAARQIRHRDRFMADTIDWWRGLGGGKTVYWAANPHVAASAQVTFALPPEVITETMAGALLRRRHGERYVSIGTLFDHGEVTVGFADRDGPAPRPVPAAAPDTTEGVLASAAHQNYLLDLRAAAPAAVDDWLDGPAVMRIISHRYDSADDSAYRMSVPSLRGAFDLLLHLSATTPTRPLQPAS